MMRIALMLEYDGSQYHGWQSQTGLRTVQQTLEKALSYVAAHEVSLVCAGRTDTGVHATYQIVHFDAENVRSMRSWIFGANTQLPKDVCVRWAKEVPHDFHARYSALSRRYRYIIYNAPIRPALTRSHVTWQYQLLDHERMHEAAQLLKGENDFTSFRSVECQSKTPMRCIEEISVTRREDWVIVDVTANAFLHHMVRNIVGVLIAVGTNRREVTWVSEVLAAKDRRQGAVTAPSYGLYLVGVRYPATFGMIKPHAGPIFL